MEQDEARASLDAARAATDSLARAAQDACPPWRHAAFGLVMGSLVLSVSLPTPLQSVLFVVAMAGVAMLATWDRRRTGVFVNGFRRGRTLPLTLALLGTLLVLVFAELHARESGLGMATRLGLAAMAFAIACLASIRFQRIYLRELHEGFVP